MYEDNQRRVKRWVPPWVKLHVADFLSSPRVARMSAVERGVFLTLLLRSWHDDGYRLDLESLADEVDLEPAELERILAGRVGRAFYVDEHGLMRNPRLEREREEALASQAQRIEAGKRSAAARRAAQSANTSEGNDRSTAVERASDDRPAADERAYLISSDSPLCGPSPSSPRTTPQTPRGNPEVGQADGERGRMSEEGIALETALGVVPEDCRMGTRLAALEFERVRVGRGLARWSVSQWTRVLPRTAAEAERFRAAVDVARRTGRLRLRGTGSRRRTLAARLDEWEKRG